MLSARAKPKYSTAFLGILVIFCVLGCANKIPKAALELTPDSLERRQLQTRRFDSNKETDLLQAGAALLQDMGFQVDESEVKLGVLVGSKVTDAENAAEIVGAVVASVLLGTHVPWSDNQKIRAALVTRPINKSQTAFRVTFQRIVWNSDGKISKVEGLDDPQLYEDFFSKLSKSVFLEAHKI